MRLQMSISLKKNRQKIGKNILVLIDELKDGKYFGRTEQDAPDIDCGVTVTSNQQHKSGDFVIAQISDADEYDLQGTTL
jgi:ribosomal protein S12 methylthiotransferase